MCPNCGDPSPWGLCLRCQGMLTELNRRSAPYGVGYDSPLTGGNKIEEAFSIFEKKEESSPFLIKAVC